MYLKSIEVQGFKSFANKILFEFHDGITGIVGPNGSGKSNVADAVRWVLGEQSAKQLRGSSMQDIIFAGTETRKPLGFAYVAITMDNSDHKLPIDFEEVTVARRVYRSGESEYLINGSSCRLRDVQELFMDTGVGKEGYSIIGQGQIDKILSGKPEDRRELFDEAAGIVKYKKRKALAEKNLEEEKLNLSRVTDIIMEIEKQLEPLEKQSVTAKEFLRLRDELKLVEVNQFLIDFENNKKIKIQLEDKSTVVENDLNSARTEFDSVKEEYEKLEEQLELCNVGLEEGHIEKGNIQVRIEKAEGEVRVLEEQVSGIFRNETQYQERIDKVQETIDEQRLELKGFEEKRDENTEKLQHMDDSQSEIGDELKKLKSRIEERVQSMEGLNNDVFRYLNSNTEIKTAIQRVETLCEQAAIKKAEFSQKLLQNKSDEAKVEAAVEERESVLKAASDEILKKSDEISALEETLKELQETIRKADADYEKEQQGYVAEVSKLESLKNLAERYDGYGSSIKKIMEQKDQNPGIIGVVADIISVEKTYETAIETALANNIQNVVTDNEDTAKELIEILKRTKAGRATFLPLTSMEVHRDNTQKDYTDEKGVIGYANTLVEAEDRFAPLLSYLLGKVIVVDTIENAITLEKKNKYSLRVVTLEGEYLHTGGSISGGTYRNNSNLLGRKREIEEREEEILLSKEKLDALLTKKEKERQKRSVCREELETFQKELQELFVKQNTAKMNLNQEQKKLSEIKAEYNSFAYQMRETEDKINELNFDIEKKKEELQQNLASSEENKDKIERYAKLLEQEQKVEKEMTEQASAIRIELNSFQNAHDFILLNISRIEQEINKQNEELQRLLQMAGDFSSQKDQKNAEIEECRQNRTADLELLKSCEERILEFAKKREEINKDHKSFFQKREDLSNRIGQLDKEAFRLQNQREKLEEYMNYSISYLWDEYELTPGTAQSFFHEELTTDSKNKKNIVELKAKIKQLGDVNVNAIEDYKEISERYEFLSKQKNDIKIAEETLMGIINELDSEMRRQFEREFITINQQFDHVFKELFGGGKGTLELTEDDNVLEAGIRIIAQPPGKKLQNMMQLSGGEKALTAIALLFAIQNLKPSPFCLVDEIEAALDDSNVKRFAKYLNKLTRETQFIVITHRRGTMAVADRLYGITMQEKGVSALVSVSLIEGDLDK